MSTYGTALVIDAPDEARVTKLGTTLASQPGADAYRTTAEDGWARLCVSWEGVGHVSTVSTLLASIGTARAAIAEDNDEFGAHWVVLVADAGTVETVHRRYVLNADPEDHEELTAAIRDWDNVDPRMGDVAGEAAAIAAAEAFGVEPTAMTFAEAESASAHRNIGVVGGPFPWWLALRLTWPGPDAGTPIEPDPARTKLVRINRATWPRFATQHVLPNLADPEQWEVLPFGLLRRPTTWLAHGVAWSGSSGDRFYAKAFVIPLYRPTEHIYFNYAIELRDQRGHRSFDLHTRATLPRLGADLARAISEEAVGYLDATATLEGYAELLQARRAKAISEGRTAVGGAEELGHTLVVLGRPDDAREPLAAASAVAAHAPEWDRARAERASLIAGLLDHDTLGAMAQLDIWAQHSADTLGITRPQTHQSQ